MASSSRKTLRDFVECSARLRDARSQVTVLEAQLAAANKELAAVGMEISCADAELKYFRFCHRDRKSVEAALEKARRAKSQFESELSRHQAALTSFMTERCLGMKNGTIDAERAEHCRVQAELQLELAAYARARFEAASADIARIEQALATRDSLEPPLVERRRIAQRAWREVCDKRFRLLEQLANQRRVLGDSRMAS